MSDPEHNDWKTVNYKGKTKNKKNTAIYGTTENTSIKGVHSYIHYHVCKLEPTVRAEDIIEYLKEKNILNVKCEKITSRRPDEYSSYKVSVPYIYKENILDPQLWPANVCINPFLLRLLERTKR